MAGTAAPTFLAYISDLVCGDDRARDAPAVQSAIVQIVAGLTQQQTRLFNRPETTSRAPVREISLAPGFIEALP